MKTFERCATVFLMIVFITFLIRHGKVDFSGIDFVKQKAQDAVESEEGQQIVDEVKDIAVDTALDITGNIKERTESSESSESKHPDLFSLLSKKKSESDEDKDSAKSNLNLLKVKLVRVVDGDTIIVDPEGVNTARVRLIGVDTPESVHPDAERNTNYGEVASAHTKTILQNVETLYLEFDEELTDQYGRFLAYVWVKDVDDTSNKQNIANYMLNGIVLSDGYAVDKVYMPNAKYADVFAELRQEACEQKRGLWIESDCFDYDAK